MKTLLCTAFCLLAATSSSAAETLIGAHTGDADPTTEGWSLDFEGPGCTAGPQNDAGTAVWTIVDDSTELNSALWYRKQLDPADLTVALSSGWRVRVELRVENAPGAGETQFFGFLSGSTAFQVHLNAEANGDATVRVVEGYPPFSGPTFVVPGGASAYHSYELSSDGTSGLASFSIDDVVVHTGYDGFPFGAANGARFGCGTSAATGTNHVRSVQFWIASSAVSATPQVRSATWGEVKAGYRR